MSILYSFTSCVIETLMTNGNSLPADLNEQNLWEDSTQNIGNDWLHGSTPLTQGEQTLANDINGLTSANIDGFFGNIANYPIIDWTSDLITTLQGKVALLWDKDKSGIWNSMASQESSLVQSSSASDTATGDSESKSAQSTLQNATTAGQPASNAGDSIAGLFKNGSSVQAQISA